MTYTFTLVVSTSIISSVDYSGPILKTASLINSNVRQML